MGVVSIPCLYDSFVILILFAPRVQRNSGGIIQDTDPTQLMNPVLNTTGLYSLVASLVDAGRQDRAIK